MWTLERQKCLTYIKKWEENSEIDKKLKICKKVFDHTYIYDTPIGENNRSTRRAKKLG